MVPARSLTRGIAALALVLAASACRRDAAPPATPRAQPAAFVQAEQVWRAERLRKLTAPDGWTSLVGLHWIDRGAHFVGSAASNGIRLRVGPSQLGLLALDDGRIRFQPAKGAGALVDGRSVSTAVLRPDDDPAGASLVAFDDGKGLATVIHRGDRYALRVKHADAPTRTAFRGLQYWPGGPDWIVDARFVPNPPGATLGIANIIGIVEPTPNPGRVEFKRNGNTYRLEALEGDGGGLFLVFADRTSGHGSYGAGRFIDTAPPVDGRVRIDFNQAYNPPCAFTPFATCPLPPDGNRLRLAVMAGEKAYH
ncbi:DUF1684 domain-containing protein [Cognatilysobacter segetis]|uniref:DUF1684 domain-containing protein n=1 Tax=Cognatilysobacter segetis TaxID=2492394 RepID=UPI00105F96B8|nr:DUF1684 domain-containing protein [Lysobacter segetis]